MEFQVLSWDAYDEYVEYMRRKSLDESLEYDSKTNGYVVEVFGRTADDKTVYAKIRGFAPFMYVKVPEVVREKEAFVRKFRRTLHECYRNVKGKDFRCLEWKVVTGMRSFDHYRPVANEQFVLIRCVNHSQLKWCLSAVAGMDMYFEEQVHRLTTYEGNLPPFIHMMHENQLSACGWVRIEKWKKMQMRASVCDVEVECEYPDVAPLEREGYANFKIMSYDIECSIEKLDYEKMGTNDGDVIIMIGNVFNRLFHTDCYRRVLFSLTPLDDVPDTEVVVCATEEELLLKWKRLVAEENPDIVTGYNLVGFDDVFIRRRVKKLRIEEEFDSIGRLLYRPSAFIEKKLTSAGLGNNQYNYYQFNGIAKIDLMKIVQRDYKLDSAKLDFVSEHFINGEAEVEGDVVRTSSTKLLRVNNFIRFKNVSEDVTHQEKYRVVEIMDATSFRIDRAFPAVMAMYRWGLVKDDMDAAQITRHYKEGNVATMTKYGEYCVQDSELCNKLMEMLCVVLKNMEMANVSNVPLDYIVYRGQGIKAHSLVALFCKRDNFLIPVLRSGARHESYEGACVFDPTPGFYIEAITVLDFSSLYPSSMIEMNTSHDTILHNNDPIDHHAIEISGSVTNDMLMTETKVVRTHRFVKADVQKGVVPRILEYLLEARKRAKKKMKAAKGTQMYSIYDGQQLAFKVTANSMYGQMGATTSPVAKREIAETTTARGRQMLEFAKYFVCNDFVAFDEAQEFLAKENIRIAPVVVYGDTDSNFINYNITDATTGDRIVGQRVLQLSIDLGKLTEQCISTRLAYPHSWAYEKVYYPFLIQKKKRYLGILYEEDVNKGKLYYMGIELKRRDNAYILKRMMKGIVNFLMDAVNRPIESFKKDIIAYINTMLHDIFDGKYDIYDFVITKTFKDDYKCKDRADAEMGAIRRGDRVRSRRADKVGVVRSVREDGSVVLEDGDVVCDAKRIAHDPCTCPSRPAHAVLADRMKVRDPMTAPKANDRISYLYVCPKRMSERELKSLKDKDRIEDIDYVVRNKLKVDYRHYVTNQLMEPCAKLLDGVIDNPLGIFKRFLARYDIEHMFEKTGQHNISSYFTRQ